MTLIEWLRAQLDADERDANEARPGFFTVETLSIFASFTETRFVITHNPARVLAEIKAKRAILDYDEAATALFGNASDGPLAAEEIVRLLAQPYADRDGWQDKWRCDTDRPA